MSKDKNELFRKLYGGSSEKPEEVKEKVSGQPNLEESKNEQS